MSNILNKSNHPVEVKRIDLKIWRLRDEIESAIERRMVETHCKNIDEVNIDDIKEFYLNILNDNQNSNSDKPSNGEEQNENLDSSGNPLDDDALAMMEALGDPGEKAQEENESNENASEEKSNENKEQEVDQESARPAEQSSELDGADDAAAAMAAAMLADQGMPTIQSEISNTDSTRPKKIFVRQAPHEKKIVKGFVLLSDIQMDQIMLFSKSSFVFGQDIVIEFLVTKPFTQNAEVKAATNISRNSKIISSVKPDFRIQCVFTFKFPGERSNLRTFLSSIEPAIPASPKKLKRPDSEDDDDFDDLGF